MDEYKIVSGYVARNYYGFNFVIPDPKEPFGVAIAGFKDEENATAFLATLQAPTDRPQPPPPPTPLTMAGQ